MTTDRDTIAEILVTVPPLCSRAKAAETLDLCERTIDRMIARGELDRMIVSGRVRIPRTSIERLLRGGV